MMSPEEITNVLDLVTTNGAVTMNITDHYGIEENKPANFIVLDAKSNLKQYVKEQESLLLSDTVNFCLKIPAKVTEAIDLLK